MGACNREGHPTCVCEKYRIRPLHLLFEVCDITKYNRRAMHKRYAQSVIIELQRQGYTCDQAKQAFFRHYRYMKRTFGLEPNVCEFAELVDEFERAINP